MIYGIGRNYLAHAKELGHAPPLEEPIVFFKPEGGIFYSDETVPLPPFSKLIHHELEVAYRYDNSLQISEITISNDLTARDKQREAMDKKLPWSLSKGFKFSCGLGSWVNSKGIDLQSLEITLEVNGKLVQHGFTKNMIFSISQIDTYLKANFPIKSGDIVLTGTPEGVGPVASGDELFAEIKGICSATWRFK